MRAAVSRFAIAAMFLALATATTASADTVLVNVGPVSFTPQFPQIRVGDTLVFRNMGGVHNVVDDSGLLFRCANGCDGDGGSGNPSSGNWLVSVQFNEPGTIGYYCETHGSPGKGMYGAVTVELRPEIFGDGFEP
jgi:plastocyanin